MERLFPIKKELHRAGAAPESHTRLGSPAPRDQLKSAANEVTWVFLLQNVSQRKESCQGKPYLPRLFGLKAGQPQDYRLDTVQRMHASSAGHLALYG